MFDVSHIWRHTRKIFTRRDVLIVIAILIAYFATRLIRLDKFPIFTDEGIYIHWAKIAWKDASMRFVSLTDGKQPLHTWGMIPFLKVHSPNLLLGGRMFSVASGLIALSGLSSLLYYLWGKRAAYIGAFLYVFTPMFLFYDRMALADSVVNAGFVWVLFGSILLARYRRVDLAIIYGLVAGFALLAKSSSTLFVGLSAFAPLLFIQKKIKPFLMNSLNYYVLYIFAATLALLIYNIQRLSPYLHYVAEKNKTFVLTFGEFLEHPFSQLMGNLPLIPHYVASEMGWVLAVLGLAGLVLLYKKDWRLTAYLCLWLMIPYISIALFAKVIFPRYLIFFATLLTIGATYFMLVILNSFQDPIKRFRNKFGMTSGAILIAISVAYFNYTILFDHARIPFPPVDRGQYIESFNAGWGVKEMIDFARTKAVEKPVILLAEGNFGVIGDMLEASIGPGEPISVRGYWPLDKQHLIENQHETATNHVYIVFSHREEFERDWPMKLVQKYYKPGGKYSYYLYELTAPQN